MKARVSGVKIEIVFKVNVVATLLIRPVYVVLLLKAKLAVKMEAAMVEMTLLRVPSL
jgi:hypothetical protein